MQEVIGIGHRPDLAAAAPEERLQELPGLLELLTVGIEQRLGREASRLLAEGVRIDWKGEIDAESFATEHALFRET